jgi:hypothetical protein
MSFVAIDTSSTTEFAGFYSLRYKANVIIVCLAVLESTQISQSLCHSGTVFPGIKYAAFSTMLPSLW